MTQRTVLPLPETRLSAPLNRLREDPLLQLPPKTDKVKVKVKVSFVLLHTLHEPVYRKRLYLAIVEIIGCKTVRW